MVKTETIGLDKLLVNTENYRFDPVTGQKEAIDKMVDSQGDKLYALARHILEHGLNPNDKIQTVISGHDPHRYNVLEGNRRVVAMKLVDNPELIDSPKHASLKKKFKSLRRESGKSPEEIECTTYEDPVEADVWIKLKHGGQGNGVGTVEWSPQQIQRFEERVEGKSSITLQAIRLLSKSPNVPEEIKAGLGTLKVTNLDRLLSDPDVRAFLGIDINAGVLQSDVDKDEVLKGLTHVVRDLLDPGFKVKRIYTKEDRMDYINTFPNRMRPDKGKTQKPWLFTDVAGRGSATQRGRRRHLDPKDRKHLIPRSCLLNIDNPKINVIYEELQQRVDLHKCTNAAAVLFRVFVELSLDCYIEKHHPGNATANSKLIAKVNEVSTHMEKNGFAEKHAFKGIRSAAQETNDLLGIDTWHAYLHNPRFSPKVQNLNVTWDNIQLFMEKLWENV